MTYTCKFKCGAETETLNELKWHYLDNHYDDYDFWTDIQPIVDQMMLESGPVEPGDTIYPDGSSKPYNPAAALFWFAVVALLPSVALGCFTTYFIWDVLPHQAALVIGIIVFMLAFFVGGVGALAIQVRESKQRDVKNRAELKKSMERIKNNDHPK